MRKRPSDSRKSTTENAQSMRTKIQARPKDDVNRNLRPKKMICRAPPQAQISKLTRPNQRSLQLIRLFRTKTRNTTVLIALQNLIGNPKQMSRKRTKKRRKIRTGKNDKEARLRHRMLTTLIKLKCILFW